VLPPLKEGKTRNQVFTHRSYFARPTTLFEDRADDPSPDNEALEHLGDSVLNLCVTILIREKYPHLRVGPATKVRSLIISNPNLATVASQYRLVDKLRVNQSQVVILRSSTSVQADVFEAYVGGLYLEQGIDVVKKWLHELFTPHAEAAYLKVREEHGLSSNEKPTTDGEQETREANPPSDLGQLAYFNQTMSQLKKSVDWKWQTTEGSKTTPIWTVDLYIDNELCVSARGSKKKLAQNEAAKEALLKLGLMQEDGTYSDTE
jgi:ribonuclease-3